MRRGLRSLYGKEGESRGLGHLYDGGLAVAHDAPSGPDGLTQGAGDAAGESPAFRGLNQGVQGSVATVGHGHQVSFSFGEDAEHPFLNGPRGLRAGDTSLEGLWRNYYSHDAKLYNVVVYRSPALC